MNTPLLVSPPKQSKYIGLQGVLSSLEFDGGGHIEYLYSATGTKLAERVYDADGSLIARRDYVGQFEFVADTLERTLLPEGFITEADGTFHAFIPDHQGNITGVYNSATNALEQFTDYYPYGLPHASATSPETNRRKYGAKELTTDLGLNLYDFAARFHNPAFPHFTTPDPLAEKYFAISPYLYCGGDPINRIDPSGMKWNKPETGNNLTSILESRLDKLNNQIEHVKQEIEEAERKGESCDKEKANLESLESQKEYLNQAILDVQRLTEDPDNVYDITEIDSNGEHKVVKYGGIIYIQYSQTALIFHEITHIRQSLDSKNGLKFDKANELLNSSSTPGGRTKKEVEAYKIQYSFNNNSLLVGVGNIKQINVVYLTRIRTKDNRPAYGFAYDYIELLKKIKMPKEKW